MDVQGIVQVLGEIYTAGFFCTVFPLPGFGWFAVEPVAAWEVVARLAPKKSEFFAFL